VCRYTLASVLLATGCGQLVEDSLAVEYVTIESPVDGATVLGRDVFPVEVLAECRDVRGVQILFDGWLAGAWYPDGEETPGCSGRPGTYCVPTWSAIALGLGSFWPTRMQAEVWCGNQLRELSSAVQDGYVAPFEGLAMIRASGRSLFAAPGGGVNAVSADGLHRVRPGAEVSGLDNRSTAARGFAVGDDLYYYAPCEQVGCDATAPDLFRIDAATLAPRGARTRLGCPPLAVVALGDQRVMALGGCDAPRVRWSAADLASAIEEPVDVRLTDRAARRGDEVVALTWRGDELVIAAAGAAPPLAMRPTGVHGAIAALSDDGARAAVFDATGRVVHVDTATGATIAAATLAPPPLGDALALAHAPGTHRVLVGFSDGAWIVDGGAARRIDPPVTEDGAPYAVRVAAALDGDRVLAIADPPESLPPRSLVYLTDGATTGLNLWVGGDWTLTAPPLLGADGTLYLAFDTLEGPVVVSHRVGAP
jgi:hypothetical protein